MRRLAEYRPRDASIHDTWRAFVEGMDYPAEIVAAAARPRRASSTLCDALPLGMARQFHACTHTTFAPTIIHGGTKINVIPDTVDLEVDIRTLPGQASAEVRAHARRGARRPRRPGRARRVRRRPATASPLDTPLWDALSRGDAALLRDGSASCRSSPSAPPTPASSAGSASTSYGFGLFSSDLTLRGLRRRCSTATTSGSTSSRCACRPSCGTPSPTTSSPLDPRDDRGGALRLRRRDPLEPVRGVRAATSAARAARRLHPRLNATEPRHERLGPARAQRGRPRRVLRRCSRPRPRAAGHTSTARDVLELLAGEIRPEMVEARAPLLGRG